MRSGKFFELPFVLDIQQFIYWICSIMLPDFSMFGFENVGTASSKLEEFFRLLLKNPHSTL